ncbi:hypothetical protein acdb102_33570 [Acidothermaceae bacterium B102]|nr:hypothetical protein acdb102_33570 [Acidothermaceae bacterium B102]
MVETEEASPWGPQVKFHFDSDLASALRAAPLPGRTDLEAGIALATVVHDELLLYGTARGEHLDDNEMAVALLALRAVTKRLGLDFDPPYRNLSTFRSFWMRNGGSGSWQTRREMLEDVFEPLHLELVRREERTFDALVYAVTPHPSLGWEGVDEEIQELRRRFQSASTPQDYRALGTNCVGVLEALSRVVYDPAKHLRQGESAPALDKTKQRIGRYVEDSLGGAVNEDVRGVANKVIELAHHVKHSPTSTRREAGIAADAVILLANILRRLEQDL